MTAAVSSMVRTLSDQLGPKPEKCKGYNDVPHRLFVTTNECGVTETLQGLQLLPVLGDTVIGVSGFFTLDCASIRGGLNPSPFQKKVQRIVIIDNSIIAEVFWANVRKFIQDSLVYTQITGLVKRLIMENRAFYAGSGVTDTEAHQYVNTEWYNLDVSIVNNTSWLSSQARFDRIKAIVMNGQLIFRRLDLCDANSIQSFALTMLKNGQSFDTLYLSNTFSYIEYYNKTKEAKKVKEGYMKAVGSLIQTITNVIYVPLPSSCSTHTQIEQVLLPITADNIETFHIGRASCPCLKGASSNNDQKTMG